MKCSHCNEDLFPGQAICHMCGKPVANTEEDDKKIKKKTGIIKNDNEDNKGDKKWH